MTTPADLNQAGSSTETSDWVADRGLPALPGAPVPRAVPESSAPGALPTGSSAPDALPTGASAAGHLPVAAPGSRLIDPRGPRFTASVTALVLFASLVLGSWQLLAMQAVVFALGVGLGPARQPYGVVFRRLVRPRLSPPAHLEDPAAPRFAQGCGLLFALVGLLGYAVGLTWLALGATAFALVAAFLNAAFDFCIGCELYLRIVRLRG